jgi:hypothetical protein
MTMTPTKSYPKMDLSGQVFDSWTVLSFYGYYGKAPTWACRRECGAVHNVMQFKLLNGQCKSCDDLEIRKGWTKDGIGYIPLTKGKVALVSPHRVNELQRWQWHAALLDGGYYAYRRQYGKGVSMARQILGLGAPDVDKREAEHANCDTLDDRDENLRLATRSQNEANKGVRRDSETGVKGVRRSKWGGKCTGRFEVRIRHLSIEIHVGVADSLDEGKAMYTEAARKLFGEFARIE